MLFIFIDTKLSFGADHSFWVNSSHCSFCNSNSACLKKGPRQSNRNKNPLSYIFTTTDNLISSLISTIYLTYIELISIGMPLHLSDLSNHNGFFELSFDNLLNFTSFKDQILSDIFRRSLHRKVFFEQLKMIFHRYKTTK